MMTSSEITAQVSGTPLDEQLVEELVDEHLALQQAFLREDYEKTLVKTGKFCETAYQLLDDLTTGSYSTSPSFKELKKQLEQLDSDDHADGIRILIPRLGKNVYDLRSRRGAVHKAEMDPLFMDAHLAVQITRWILAEFLREFGDYEGDSELLEMQIEHITTESLPMVEEFEDGDVKVLIDVESAKEEILLILYHFYPERVSVDQLNEFLPGQSRANVRTNVNNAAKKDRYVHRNDEGAKLTKKGKRYVEEEYGSQMEVIGNE